tara:strand:+ start:2705 stop:3142 length:438 start_codon:yes stop_codon:yes gene_type:complete
MWYNKYTNLPFEPLGDDPVTGIDCFNLVRLMFKQELKIIIPYESTDVCDDYSEDWYNRTDNTKYRDPFLEVTKASSDWIKVESPQVYDVMVMTLGGTNIANHCAMYVDSNKILNIMINKKSWVTPYGNYYRQYTNGIFRWSTLIS